MATLVTCKLCKKEHSDDVARCPSCGVKYNKPLSKRPFALAVLGIFGFMVFTAVVGSIGGRDPTPATTVQTMAPVAASTPVSTAELTAKFATERAGIVQRLNASLKTKDHYSVIGVANDYEAVADSEFRDLLKKVRADEEKTTALNLKKLDAEEKKEARKKGVNIGMTKAQVLASMWGKPQSINTTTSAYGNREQWVYGGRSYLYFENGILTTIQN